MNSSASAVRLIRAVLVIAALSPGSPAMAIEEPAYTVRHTAGKIEYREYAAYLTAETLVEGGADFESAGNEGFRRLFRYISGGNKAQSKIAMTAPVSQAAESEKIAMTFRCSRPVPRAAGVSPSPCPRSTPWKRRRFPRTGASGSFRSPRRLYAVLALFRTLDREQLQLPVATSCWQTLSAAGASACVESRSSPAITRRSYPPSCAVTKC
jgi:hypothetical protein